MKYKTSLVFICFLLPYIGLCKKKSKSVSTIIDAKWHLTPIALEISEYLAEDDPSLFWRYVDYINALQPALIDSGTDKDRYERALGEASRILSNSQLNLLKLSLAMHSDSPRVEMYNQIALQRGVKCPVALDVGDALLCTLDSLENTINSYLERQPRKVRLSGYGVELQMKSTEYKATDDAAVQDKTGAESVDEDEQEVEGFNFQRLNQGDLYAMGPVQRSLEWQSRLHQLHGCFILIAVCQSLFSIRRQLNSVQNKPTLTLRSGGKQP
ncbi:UDP-glucose:glycoprotein glucosyltransferase 2-like [Diaphorina citri]|uniref:UDP-glucose:glycoprotein glucosyltransferase 2-like n=1 Tax=Diaphorina citri TaxID=121845 RepID=A0A1S3CZQ3_DIACI|nr:UDP-glucose:glycoprotein glucosyltransferase 2-like [Diaphorina citri]